MTQPVLPPHQQLVASNKWPIIGERTPREDDSPWRVNLFGEVKQPLSFSVEDLSQLPQTTQVADIHCVTRWSKLHVKWEGVLLQAVLKLAEPTSNAEFVSFVARSERNHSTSLTLQDAIELNTLIALRCDDELLSTSHGGPVRIVVANRYFYKSLKWLESIELLAEDRLGFWEAEAGYHNHADPWKEQRYLAANLNKQEVAKLLEERDFSSREFGKRDLRSIDCSQRELNGLQAKDALLRDANFQSCTLQNACFENANLSNAHFENADLTNASFVNADLEGASFIGANLSGCNFSGASLFGVSFCTTTEEFSAPRTIFDSYTKMEPDSLDALTPLQQEFLKIYLPNNSRPHREF